MMMSQIMELAQQVLAGGQGSLPPATQQMLDALIAQGNAGQPIAPDQINMMIEALTSQLQSTNFLGIGGQAAGSQASSYAASSGHHASAHQSSYSAGHHQQSGSYAASQGQGMQFIDPVTNSAVPAVDFLGGMPQMALYEAGSVVVHKKKP